MTAADRRLATLAAAFARESATSLLARWDGAGAADVVAHAARLAAAPRDDRLRALAAGLSADRAPPRAAAEETAAAERPRVARILRAVACGTPAASVPGVSPVLLRLCLERLTG